MRAGLLSLGEDATKKAVAKKEAAFVLLDDGASPNAKKMIKDACVYYKVPWYPVRAGEIGNHTGKPGRMSVAVHKGKLADRLLLCLQRDEKETGEPPS